MKTIRVLQINLQHKKFANDMAMKQIEDNNIDIVLIQEPYISTKSNRIPSIPTNYTTYYQGNKAVAAIIIKKDIKHINLTKTMTEKVVAVRVETFDKTIIFVSCYSPRQQEPVPFELEEKWLYYRRLAPNTILGADTNSHSTFLKYKKSDQRAVQWEEFTASKNLILCNNPDSITFENTRKQTSKIDWTLCTNIIHNFIKNWNVPNDWITLSDHKAILFSVLAEPIWKKRFVFDFKRANWKKILNNFDSNLEGLRNSQPLTRFKDIDDYTENLTEIIKKTISDHVPSRRYVKHKNAWWSRKLENKKKEVKTAKNKNHEEYLNRKLEFENLPSKETSLGKISPINKYSR